MGSASLSAAVDRPHALNSLLRSLDRPARTALDLARRPVWATLAPALSGLFLVAASTVVAGAFSREGLRWLPQLDALRAVLESLLVVVPGTTVLAIYLRLRISARSLLAGISLGLLSAGVVAACLLPLVAFLSVVAVESRRALPLSSLVPAIALATVGLFSARVMTALDSSSDTRWLARSFICFLGAVFLLRINAALYKSYSLTFW